MELKVNNSTIPVSYNNYYKNSNLTFRAQNNIIVGKPAETEDGWFRNWISDKDKVSTDGNDDGKISFWDKVKSVGKGLMCMVKAAIQHPIATIATVAGGIALTALTGGAILPVLIAAGVTIGSVQIGYGAYKAATAKTDGEAKTAWEDIGSGIFAVGTSVFGAKGALKTSGIDTSKMGPVKSTIECFKQVPSSVSKSISSIKIKCSSLIKYFSKSSAGTKDSAVTRPVSQTRSVADYKDDGVYGYDSYDEASALRDEMRNRILREANLSDENLTVKPMDDVTGKVSQLSADSKYSELGKPRMNSKTGKQMYVCENLKDMPDANGVRGKTPLSGNNNNAIRYRLRKMQESGIRRVIDLRAQGECSKRASQILSEMGIDYVNFPVEDGGWTKGSLDSITRFINAINKGDFYVGCANGQARTDLAVSLNYLLNPKAKGLPQLYYGTVGSSRISIKSNLLQILKLVENNKNIVLDWGWDSYEQFIVSAQQNLKNLLISLS